jgi:type I restriction enzyme S subunit
MLPEGWRKATVAEVCETVSVGIVVNPSHYYVEAETGVRAFRSANVRENRVNEEKWVYLSKEGQEKNRKSILRRGDVLVVRTGFPGTACVVPPHLAGSNCIDVLFARPNPDLVLSEYLCELTNSDIGRQQVLNGQSGLAQKHLNASTYAKLSFRLPPISEQMRIVQILGTWGKAIAAAERLLANSQEQKRTLMRLLLTAKRRVHSARDHWYHVDFDEVFERVTHKNADNNTNVLTISGQYGLISQNEFFSKIVASDNLTGYTVLGRGEFAYNRSYSAGYPMGAIKPLERYDAGVVSSLYICFRLRKPSQPDYDFFRHYFEAGLLNEGIAGIAQEGARNHGLLNVSIVDFFKLRLHVPPSEERRQIAEILNTAEAKELSWAAQLERLQREKRALMCQLLTGRRRVRLPASAEAAA